MVVTMFFFKSNSQLQICNVKKESHIDGVYDEDTEVYTIPKKKDLKVQPVYLTRNQIFIAHSKCVHAGCEASTRKSFDLKSNLLVSRPSGVYTMTENTQIHGPT